MAKDDVSSTFVDRGQRQPDSGQVSGTMHGMGGLGGLGGSGGMEPDEPTDLGLVAEPEEVEPVYEPPGRLIGGQYRIERPLAQGGMGSVYLASQVGLERRVALKALASEQPELLERFRREAVSLAEVSHPGVVEIYDFIPGSAQTQGRCYLIMAFIDGVDLEAHIRTQPEKRLAPQAVVELVLPVCSALVELHANGIIHRDLKPANLVRYVRADGRAFAKLVDFGIARREVDPGLTATGSVLGTPAYLAPEAMFGRKQTPLSDIYSLGATLFELVAGTPPFGDGKPVDIIRRVMEHRIDLPPDTAGTRLGDLIVQMLEMEPDKRPSALQVFETMEALAHGFGERPPAAQALPTQPPLPAGTAGAAAQEASQRATRPRGVTAIPGAEGEPQAGGAGAAGAAGAPGWPGAPATPGVESDPFAQSGPSTQALPVDHTDPVGFPLPGPGRAARSAGPQPLVIGLAAAAGVLAVALVIVMILWLGARSESAAQRSRAAGLATRIAALEKAHASALEKARAATLEKARAAQPARARARAGGAEPSRPGPERATPREVPRETPRATTADAGADAGAPTPARPNATPDAAAPPPRPVADAHGPTAGMLAAACKTTRHAQILLRASRKQYERKGGDVERARRGFRALLDGTCAPLRLKRSAAQYLLQLHLKRRDCAAAKAAHAELVHLHRRLGSRRPRYPGCK